ncbi:hypothetical protein C2G38_2214994 [Gigaspora rosea]|uniref:Protein kinase domain-containing protein n=1 Tax=Gigaspora rosea TaxID=44941 RepID=A0A397UEM2_9GLOM|nr:hypothetical protein C2G38_2214994 [Gigaspora rosea]
MGLSKKYNKNDSEGCIYGIMPFVAPEVLSGQVFTEKADIYGFGVIMSEISTGQRPFDSYQFNEELAAKIFAPGTPDYKFQTWIESMENSDNNDSDKIAEKLPINLGECRKSLQTHDIIVRVNKFRELEDLIPAWKDLAQAFDSAAKLD